MHCRTTNATIFLTLSIATAACGDTTPSALTGDNAGTVVPVRVESRAAGAGGAGPSAGSAAPVARVRSAAVDDAASDAGTRDTRADAAMENPGTANMVAGSGGAGGQPQPSGSGGSGGHAGASAGSGGAAQTPPGDDDDEEDDD